MQVLGDFTWAFIACLCIIGFFTIMIMYRRGYELYRGGVMSSAVVLGIVLMVIGVAIGLFIAGIMGLPGYQFIFTTSEMANVASVLIFVAILGSIFGAFLVIYLRGGGRQ